MLAGYASVWAQSGGASKGQAGAGPTNYARKANTSQTQGKGIPYPKDKEQQGRAEAKGGTPATTGSSASSGSTNIGQGNMKSGKKSGTKSSGKNQ